MIPRPHSCSTPRDAVDDARRGFLGAALRTPVAAAIALLASPVAARPDTAPSAASPSGYHMSEHIRTYYELAARF